MIEAILKAVQIGDALGTGVKNSTRNEYGRPSIGGTATDNFINPFWGSGWTRINQLGSSLISPTDKALSGLSWLGGPLTQSLFDEYINKKMDKMAYINKTTVNNTINANMSEIGKGSGKTQSIDLNTGKTINPAVKQYYEDEQKIRDLGTSIIGGASTIADTGLLSGLTLDGATTTKGRADKAALKAAPTTPKEATFDDTASLLKTTSGNKLFDAGTGMDFYAAKGGKTMNKSEEVVAGEAGKEWLVDIKTGQIIEELDEGAEKINLKPGTAVINKQQMQRLQNGEPFESVIASLPNVQNVDQAQNGAVDPDSWLNGFKYLYSWIPKTVKDIGKGSEQLFRVGKEIMPNFNSAKPNQTSFIKPSNIQITSPTLSTIPNKYAGQSYSKSTINQESLSNSSSKPSSNMSKQTPVVTERTLTFGDLPITNGKLVRMPSRSFDTNKGLVSGMKPTKLSFGTPPSKEKKDSWFKKTFSNLEGEDAILAANTLYNTLAAIENSKKVNSEPISNVPLARPAMVSASKVNAEPLLRMQSRVFNTALSKAIQTGRTDMIPLILAANSNALQTVNESVAGRNAELENSVRGGNATASNQFSLAKFQTGQDIETRNKMMKREDSLIDFTRKGQQLESLANLLYGAGQYKLNKKQRKDLEEERNLYLKQLSFPSQQ